MRTPVLIRRLREISKRAYRDLIAITETIQTTLTQTHVRVTDAVAYLRDSVFRFLNIAEDITITEHTSGTLIPSRSFSASDSISNIVLAIVETLAKTKSAVIEFIIPESISIGETTDVELETPKSHTQSELISIILSILESLSYTVSSVIKIKTDEAVGIADDIKSTILSTLPLDITDGIASLALKTVESLSVVCSSIINLIGLSEDLSISDKIDSLELDTSGSFSLSDDMSCAVACDGGCDVCVNCQDCVTCDKCNVACYTCDVCYGSCVSCETCYAFCDAYEACYDCVSCEKCNTSCYRCYSCNVSCYTCEKCDTTCYSCDTCDGTCETCETCIAVCQICETCEGCYTCERCVTFCQNCFSCEKCDAVCYKCFTCDITCYTCEECDLPCYWCDSCQSLYSP